MNLTKSQKKLIKKNLKKLPLPQLAQKINVAEMELNEYLKSVLPEEKYQKFIVQRQNNPSKFQSQDPLNLPPSLTSWFKKHSLAFLFLAILVGVVYFNSVGNEFLSDDIAGIAQEKNIGNPFYFLVHQPINFFRYLVFAIVYHSFGLKPSFFRLANIFFHLSSSWIIYSIVVLLHGQLLALIASSLFAAHPIQIEGVTWIAGGIHAQYVFFDLLAFFLYLLVKSNPRQKKFYFASLASFFVALFTTEKSAILPLLLITFELSYGEIRKNWKKLAPYFLLGGTVVCFVFLGPLFKRMTALQTQYYQEKGFYNPLTQIPIAISSYLSLIFWPDMLTLYHSEMNFATWQYTLMSLVTLSFLGITAYSFINKKYRHQFFWLSFFVITLLPMLTPFKVAWIVAERYVYFGAAGIYVIVGFVLQKIGKFVKNNLVIYIILGTALIPLSIRTIRRNVDWKNQDNLWLAAERTSPSSPQNHNNLGDLYARRSDFKKAAEEFQKAILLKPDYGDAYHNLANVYRQMGQIDLSEQNYLKAISLNPNIWQSYQNLAVTYYEKGKFDEALKMSQRGIELNPQNPDLHFICGIIYFNLGNKELARKEIQKTLEIAPGSQKAKEFLSQIDKNP